MCGLRLVERAGKRTKKIKKILEAILKISVTTQRPYFFAAKTQISVHEYICTVIGKRGTVVELPTGRRPHGVLLFFSPLVTNMRLLAYACFASESFPISKHAFQSRRDCMFIDEYK